MTIEQLPSGSYRIRKMDHGKLYTLTVKKKPTDRVAKQLIDEKIDRASPYDGLIMRTACAKYLAVKKNVLSPSTFREYTRTAKALPEDFLEMDICEITDYDLQKVVNDLAATLAPKTVRNYHGFICAVLRLFNPKVKYTVTLPQKRHVEPYTPSYEEVKIILNYAYDTDYFVPFFLATLSLRASEICALNLSDLNDNNQLTISKAYVRGIDGYVLKDTPKTDASYRTILLPDALADRIREQGYIYRYHPGQLDKTLHRIQKKLDVPSFSLHKFRHFFASYAHDIGLSDAQIQKIGGWSSDVMKRVYRHALDTESARGVIADEFSF